MHQQPKRMQFLIHLQLYISICGLFITYSSLSEFVSASHDCIIYTYKVYIVYIFILQTKICVAAEIIQFDKHKLFNLCEDGIFFIIFRIHDSCVLAGNT